MTIGLANAKPVIKDATCVSEDPAMLKPARIGLEYMYIARPVAATAVAIYAFLAVIWSLIYLS